MKSPTDIVVPGSPSEPSGTLPPLANRYPELYERRFARIYPAWFLSFQFEVLK